VARKFGSGISADGRSDDMLLRHSGFVGPHVLVTRHTWRSIADLVWKGKTLPDACTELGLDWRVIDRKMSEDVRSFLLDVAMVAGAKEEYLGASNDTNNQ
jgi:hypothetical protein